MKKDAKNCWEYSNCLQKIKELCPAYTTKIGHECWLVASSHCHEHHDSFYDCMECAWFKKQNPYPSTK